MAKIVSHVWSSARGSIAGITYLTTPSGAIIARQRVIPVNAPTPFRTFIKDALIEAVSDWDGLTVAQKAAWNLWAAANGLLTGRQEFVGVQSLRNYVLGSGIAGVTVITQNLLAPDFAGHPAVTHAATTFTTALSTGVAFKNRVTSAQKCIVVLELSPGLSNGRYFWKGPWDNTKTIAFDLAAGATVTTTFPGLNAGLRYYCRMRAYTHGTTAGGTGMAIGSPMITYSDAITNP